MAPAKKTLKPTDKPKLAKSALSDAEAPRTKKVAAAPIKKGKGSPAPEGKKSAAKLTPTPEKTAPGKGTKSATPKKVTEAKSSLPKTSEAAGAPAPKTGPKGAKAKSIQTAPAQAPSPQASMEGPPAVQSVQRPSAPGTFPEHMQTALQAATDGKAIELIFKDADSNPPRTFEPRHLMFDTLTKAWYVWGWDRRYNAERHHRLDQMAEVNLVDGPGRSAQGPYKEGTPPNLIGGWLGGDPIHVKASLQKQWIFAVKQAPPAFPEFKIEDAEDGKATVSFVATDLRAIARWCLQFGDGIQVLEPQRLVDRVKQVGVAWGGKPTAAASAPAPAAPKPLPPAPRHEPRPEPRSEHKPEYRRDQPKEREEAPKKGPKVEVRIERL